MRIKILYTQETIGSGGVERRRLNLINALDKNIYEIKVVCTKIAGPIADEMKSAGVEVIEVGSLDKIWRLSRYRSVLKIINKFQPHIIHGAVFEGVLLATVAGFVGRVPTIIAEETSDPQNRSKKASYLLKALTLVADRVIAIAPNVGAYLKDVAKIAPSKIKIITNGVKEPRLVALSEIDNLKNSLGILQEDIIIGSVGRLFNDHKKFTDILNAMSLLKHKSLVKLVIVGDGPDRDLIIKEANSLGLSENLIMVGFQSDTAPYYKLMNVFCLASQREGFGLVAAEAMFHRLPVVATRVGGLQDIVIDGETGVLVDANRPEQIAFAFEKLLADQSLRQNMGKRGYARAHSEYSAERYVREVENLYTELLRQKQII